MFFRPESYRWTKNHFKDILNLSEKLGGLVVSIYAICCDVKNDPTNELEQLKYGYQDNYAKINFVKNKKFPSPTNSEEFEIICSDAQTINVHVTDIKMHGPKINICSKCNCIYGIQDSSHGDELSKLCGHCRKGKYTLTTYTANCVKCNRGYVIGFRQEEIKEEKCIYCTTPPRSLESEHERNFMFHVIKSNQDAFAQILGIPKRLITLYIQNDGSLAKIFRTDSANPETSMPLNYRSELFQETDWNQTLKIEDVEELNVNIKHQRLIATSECFRNIVELFNADCKFTCSVCFDEFNQRDIIKPCKNKNCSSHVCKQCHKSMIVLAPGEQITNQKVLCIICRQQLKPGFIKDPIIGNEITTLTTKKYSGFDLVKVLQEGVVSVSMCKNINCSEGACNLEFPFVLRENECGQSHEPDSCSGCKRRQQELLSTRPPTFEQLGMVNEPDCSGIVWHNNEQGQKIPYRQCSCERIFTFELDEPSCFHMECPCGVHSCWACGKEFDEAHQVYDHISECDCVEEREQDPEYIKMYYSWYNCEHLLTED